MAKHGDRQATLEEWNQAQADKPGFFSRLIARLRNN